MIRPLLDHLGDNGATNVLVEGGGEVLSSFFSAGEVDETHIYIGPKTFGGRDAAGPVGGIGVNVVSDATLFDLIQLDRFDDDIRLIYRRK
jgi:diaminohydroxyphosphoribosylaminopyrimidine deaminase/5-amino-6-(5-phosphoribosylamino)uracil reductase